MFDIDFYMKSFDFMKEARKYKIIQFKPNYRVAKLAEIKADALLMTIKQFKSK